MTDRTVRVRVLAEMPGYRAMMREGAADTVRLGEAAVAAGRGVRSLGVDAAASRAGLTGMALGARGGAAATRQAEIAALAAGRGVRTAAVEADAARGAFGRIGAAAASGLGTVRSASARAMDSVKHLGLLLAGGAIIYGLHDIVHAGNEYTDSMNKFLEVTRASGGQMAAAGREAQALGADMKLPSANAAEAADAMVELAKAGLGAEDAIRAARGTIQLSAAARTDVATAARIEGDIMDQFALKSTEATRVADTLANTANSASGELMDIYYAMKYVGPIAHTMGVSLQETATAVGLLGKSGIIGETAGTALRSALVNMSKPTKLAREGLKTLGIQAYDSQGRFKGLQYVIGQLGAAQEHLTTQQFTAASAMAFGKPALSAMVALAHQGNTAFEQFGVQVGRVGGAAALAAAESKGLGGAMRGLGKQISSAFLQVYLGVAPFLEKVTRGMTSGISSAIPVIKRGIRTATDLWDIYGPAVAKKLDAAEMKVKASAGRLTEPLRSGLTQAAITAVPLAVTSVTSLDKALHNAGDAVDPLVGGMQDVATSVSSGAGALGVFTTRAQAGVSMLGDATGVLRPLAEIVGGLAHTFAGLPGPIQLSVISMLALRPFRPQIQGMQQAVTNFGRAGVTAFRGIGDASLYQRVQAANAGVTLGRFGGIVAELEHRSAGMAAMGTAFRGVYTTLGPTASGLQRVGGALRGMGAAAGVGALRGLRSAAGGLMGLFGGPWGLAIGGAMAALDYFSRKNRAAKQAVAEFTQSIQQDSGALGENTRALVAQKLSQAGALDTAAKYHIQLGLIEKAALGDKKALQQVNDALIANGGSYQFGGRAMRSMSDTQTRYRSDAQKLKDLLGDTNSTVGKAAQAYKNQKAAIAGAASATADATDPTSRLQTAIKTLASSEADADTKARALHQALDLLSGGELDVEAAVATMNQDMLDLNALWKDGVDKTKGYRGALLQVDGSLNTTSENGQALWNRLQQLNEGTASAAQATYDFARANGTEVVPALQKAEARMESAWRAAVTTAQKFGLNADQAKRLAAQMGFIPSSLAITMSTPGLTDTEKQLLYVQGLAAHLPKGASVRVSALTKDAVKAIESVGVKVKTMPGGRQMEITAPTAKAQAGLDKLLATMMRVPSHVDTTVSTPGAQKAAADLDAVRRRLAAVPAGKSITVKAPPSQAIADLRAIGYKVVTLPNHQVRITVPTRSPAAALADLAARIRALQDKTVRITIDQRVKRGEITSQAGKNQAGLVGREAAGGVRHYAGGGTERHVAQIARAGEWRVWAEDETGGEAYIPLAASKRARSRAIAEETVRRLGGKGIAWQAAGGLRYMAEGGFTYTPTSKPVLGGPTDPMDRYNAAIQKLKDAWSALSAAMKNQATQARQLADAETRQRQTRTDGARRVSQAEANLERVRSHHHTAAQLAAAEDRLANARAAAEKADKAAARRTAKERADVAAANRRVASARGQVNAADAELGLRAGSRPPARFDLGAYQKELGRSVAATESWRKSLDRIGKRGGSELRSVLEGMGEDGYALVKALAKASDKQFADITKKLLATAGQAKASLADFENQINGATKTNAQFASDLQKLAAEGFGDLAQALASQGDAAAQSLAHQAAGSKGTAAKANKAVGANQQALTGQDLTNALTLITVLRAKPGGGFAALAAAGLDSATVKALAPRMMKQINALPGQFKTEFLKELAGQGGATAMAAGGILTRPTAVVAAEAGVPEAYIPINGSARSLGLLARTAAAMGYQVVPASRWAGVAQAGGGTTHIDRSHTWHLHGAHQSMAEQTAELERRMRFVS